MADITAEEGQQQEADATNAERGEEQKPEPGRLNLRRFP
jgi:hypothetical protein